MPHFAEIDPDTNIVIRVIRAKLKIWCEYNLGGEWVRTYYETPGKNYAAKGYMYHPDKENFSMPQPYPSWTLDGNCKWQPPVSHPEDDKSYIWNEETQSWDEDNLLS